MGIQARKTIVAVLAIAVVAYGSVFRTMGTVAHGIVGGLLALAAVVYVVLLWLSRRVGEGDERPSSRAVWAAAAGASLTILLVLYAPVYEDLTTAWRIALGAALAAFGLGVAWALWPSWKAAVSSGLALAVVAYGVVFDSVDEDAQVAMGIALAVILVLVSLLVWRKAAVVFSALLAYGLVAYRLFFESIDDVGWRTLVGAALIFAVILIALKWWLYWQFPRARWAAGVITTISLGLVVFTLVGGVDLLGTRQPPRVQAEAPAVGFVSPKPATPGRGFAIGMGITVKRCDEPVHVKLVAAGTAEYWEDHPVGGDFKLGIPGRRGKDLTELRYGSEYLSVVNPMDSNPFEREGRDWKATNVQNMTVISGRLPAYEEVAAEFDATSFDEERKWLEERGQGTCYLRLPALAGNFTAFAAEQADGRAYPEKKLPQELVLKRQGECVPQLSERMHHGHRLEALYCPEAEIVHGSVAVRAAAEGESAGEVLADESLPEPDTVVEGDPVWSCRSDPRGRDKKRSTAELFEVRGGLPYSRDRLEREIAPNCSGFVAFSEADADERRDVTLILIGIGVALGLGAFIELVMRWIEAEFPLKHRPGPTGAGVG
jgi:hypothetical protein